MAGEPRVPASHPGDAAADVLKSATLDLTRSLELDSIFESLLQHLRRLVPYDTANVMLLENDSRITVRALSGYEHWSDPDLTRGATFDVATHPIFGTLIATRRSILIPDTSVHPGWQRHEGADHVRNWMGVPLLAADRVIGLYAVDKAEPGFFTSEHLRFTEALAPHAALAIRNARLYEQIQRSEERFRALVDNSNEVVSLLDRHGVTLYSSQSSAAILGDSVEDLVGQTPFERVHPEDRPEVQALFESCLRSPGFPLVSEFRMRHRSGSWRTVEAVLVNRLDDPSVAAAVLNYRDVTDRKRAQQKIEDLNRDLQRQVAEFETLLEVIPIGIGIARDPACRRIEGNPYMTRLMGGTPRENISFSAPTGEAQPTTTRIYRDGQPLAPEELPMQRAAAQGAEVVDMEMDVVRDGQKVATILGYAAPLFDESGRPRGAIGASLDITERKRAEEQIKGLAYLDALTGLPNRRLFQDRLSVAIAQAHRNGQGLAVLYLDLDRFKPVNDSLGHAAGDRLIQDVAERLRTCLREGDTVARLGGDEFSMLLPGVSQVVDAARVAEKVLDTFRRPFQIEGREIFATASIGISLYPEDGADVESLVKNADAAMYRAKQQGRDNYQLYAPALNATALERLALESHLRHALSKDQLVVHYQPVVEHATGRVHAMEALLRWRHPELGLVPPGDFIPLAEVTGQIIAFGPWVLRAACAQTREWQEAGHSDLGVAVNLSARQFQHPDLVAQVRRALDETKLDPSFLELEITESSAMHGEAAVQTMRELKALGVRIAIDDFGTGYSSLSYLRRFPIDTLKIDRSFIADITRDPDDAAIATAVIALAHTLKLRVVAEGVETDEQVAFLSARRCDLVQGYLFGAPRPAEDSGGQLEAPLGVRAIRA